MSTTTRPGEKRTATVLEYLSFPVRTNKRVAWESWEFTVVGPYQVRVTNASYGYLKDDHAYVVGVEERDGVVVPAECECPADVHHEPDCKHKVALATVAGPTVLNAAVAFEKPSEDSNNRQAAATVRDVLDDGHGLLADVHVDEDCTCGNEWCVEREVDSLSCFECFESSEGQ